MATAQDTLAVSRGLDSITQAVLGNYMARRARELEEEEKRRFEQQRADRIAAQVAMRQDRERLRKFQEDQAKATADLRASELERRNRLDAEKAAGAADTAARQNAFTNLLSGEAAPLETSQFEHLNPTGEALPLTAESILKAGAQTGTLTPQQMAEIALRNQTLAAKSGPAADVKPQPFRVTLENGAQVVGIHNPRTGAYQVFDGEKEIVAKQLKDEQGRPVPGKFVVNGNVIQAKQPEIIKTKEIYDELARLDAWEEEDSPAKKRMKDWEAKFPPAARVGNAALGQQAAELKAEIVKETAALKARRNSLMKTLQMLAGEDATDLPPADRPASTTPPAAAPPAAPAGKPLSKEQAALFLRQAGGDKDKARALAKQAGFTF